MSEISAFSVARDYLSSITTVWLSPDYVLPSISVNTESFSTSPGLSRLHILCLDVV